MDRASAGGWGLRTWRSDRNRGEPGATPPSAIGLRSLSGPSGVVPECRCRPGGCRGRHFAGNRYRATSCDAARRPHLRGARSGARRAVPCTPDIPVCSLPARLCAWLPAPPASSSTGCRRAQGGELICCPSRDSGPLHPPSVYPPKGEKSSTGADFTGILSLDAPRDAPYPCPHCFRSGPERRISAPQSGYGGRVLPAPGSGQRGRRRLSARAVRDRAVHLTILH